MTTAGERPRSAGLAPDLAALRRYLWLPVASLAIAVAAALIIGAVTSSSGDARFRANVVVDALPPLFGPAVVPGPFDYARLAASDGVLGAVAQQSGIATEALKPRLTAQAQLTRPEIDLKVTGPNALALARTWQRAFTDAATQQTVDLERELTLPYTKQLAEAARRLQQQSAAAKGSPDDAVAQQQLKAAEENFETASKLSQSYEVVASTMKAQVFVVTAPHTQSAGVGSTAGRLGAAVAIGLLAGVIGALLLDFAVRRREAAAGSLDSAPAALRRDAERRSGSAR